MIKIKIEKVKNSEVSLSQLIQMDLPIAASFQVSRLMKALTPEIQTFQENWDKYVRQFGVPDSNDPQKYSVEPGKIPQFMSAVQPLLDVEVELNVSSIKISDLGNISIKPQILTDLDWFIKEE